VTNDVSTVTVNIIDGIDCTNVLQALQQNNVCEVGNLNIK
jgi:hypothetical protein